MFLGTYDVLILISFLSIVYTCLVSMCRYDIKPKALQTNPCLLCVWCACVGVILNLKDGKPMPGAKT